MSDFIIFFVCFINPYSPLFTLWFMARYLLQFISFSILLQRISFVLHSFSLLIYLRYISSIIYSLFVNFQLYSTALIRYSFFFISLELFGKHSIDSCDTHDFFVCNRMPCRSSKIACGKNVSEKF